MMRYFSTSCNLRKLREPGWDCQVGVVSLVHLLTTLFLHQLPITLFSPCAFVFSTMMVNHLLHAWLTISYCICLFTTLPTGGGSVTGSSSGSGARGDNSGENSPGSVMSYGSTSPRGMSGGPGPGPGSSALPPGLIRKVKQSTSDRSISTLFGCICDPFGTFSSSREEDKEEGTDHTQFVSGSVIGENNPNHQNSSNHNNNKNNR